MSKRKNYILGVLIVVIYSISKISGKDEVVVEYMSNSDLMIEYAGEKLKFLRIYLEDVKLLYEELITEETSSFLLSCRGYEGEWKTFFHGELETVILVIYLTEEECHQAAERGISENAYAFIKNNQFMVVKYDLKNENRLTINSTLITKGASKVIAFARPKKSLSIKSDHDHLLISFNSNLTLKTLDSRNKSWNGYIFCNEFCIWEKYRGNFPLSYNQFRSKYFSCHDDSLIESNSFTAFKISDDLIEQYQSQSFQMGEFDIYKEDSSIVYGKVSSLDKCKRVYFRVCEIYEVEISLIYDARNEKCKYIFDKIEMKDNYVPCVLKMMIDLTGRGFFKVVETTMQFDHSVDTSMFGVRPRHYYKITGVAFLILCVLSGGFYYFIKTKKQIPE